MKTSPYPRRPVAFHSLVPPGLAAALLALTPAVPAGTIWNEANQGDLSNLRDQPTSVTLSLGSNDLFATTQSGDREYVTFQVPSGHTLSSVYLRAYAGGDDRSFFGIEQGTAITVDPASPTVGSLLGYTHFGRQPATPAVVGTDFLPLVGQGPGAQGFTPPLAANSYSLWIQQLGATPTTYQIDFVISAVPEPVSTTACSLGLLAAGILIRRHREQSSARTRTTATR